MNAISLFANIGVAEAYLKDIDINVVVANELVERRANLYSKIYPEFLNDSGGYQRFFSL